MLGFNSYLLFSCSSTVDLLNICQKVYIVFFATPNKKPIHLPSVSHLFLSIMHCDSKIKTLQFFTASSAHPLNLGTISKTEKQKTLVPFGAFGWQNSTCDSATATSQPKKTVAKLKTFSSVSIMHTWAKVMRWFRVTQPRTYIFRGFVCVCSHNRKKGCSHSFFLFSELFSSIFTNSSGTTPIKKKWC